VGGKVDLTGADILKEILKSSSGVRGDNPVRPSIPDYGAI
jgi:hypothetical protein